MLRSFVKLTNFSVKIIKKMLNINGGNILTNLSDYVKSWQHAQNYLQLSHTFVCKIRIQDMALIYLRLL